MHDILLTDTEQALNDLTQTFLPRGGRRGLTVSAWFCEYLTTSSRCSLLAGFSLRAKSRSPVDDMEVGIGGREEDSRGKLVVPRL